DSIDWDSLAREVDWAFAQGANGLCTGMVSELLRLTTTERMALTARLAEMKQGRGVFVAGIGAESTKQAVEFGRHAAQVGADAVMAIPPISTALPDDQVLAYFTTIAEEVAVPLIVQDASSYVGKPIPHDVCVRLLDAFGPDRILFKPEASPLGPNLSALRDITGGRARIFEGSGGICLVDSFRRGIAGTMPGVEFLRGITALWHALQEGDDDAIYRIYFPICALVALQLQAGLDGFLAVEKYLLHKQGLFATDRRRRPCAWSLDEETRLEVDRLVQRLDAACED
ncbi:MAG: dihydrodipicolinate synthase family protein, partial [Planctomycetaceae bacterium]|nr:dihydrodipicolinate synthase family protein [Planctomycetaceae bacterium]